MCLRLVERKNPESIVKKKLVLVVSHCNVHPPPVKIFLGSTPRQN